jgi:putative membrane protein
MIVWLAHLAITAALLMFVGSLVKGIEVKSGGSALLAALALGLVNAVVRPLMILLTLPLTVLTFGLFLWVVNALMLRLAAGLVPGVQIEGFGAAMWGSLLLTVLNIAVALLLGPMALPLL